MTEQEIQAARKARAEYFRRYRKEHPDRVKETSLRYWAKKAKQKEDVGQNEEV